MQSPDGSQNANNKVVGGGNTYKPSGNPDPNAAPKVQSSFIVTLILTLFAVSVLKNFY